MKKLLLASTALVIMGGSAMAASHSSTNFKLKAGASFGTWDDGTVTSSTTGGVTTYTATRSTKPDLEYTAELGWSAEMTTNGISYGASGNIDLTGSVSTTPVGGVGPAHSGTSANIEDARLWISGGFGKFIFEANEFDNTDSEKADIQYTGTFGAIEVLAEVDAEVLTGATEREWFAKASYKANGFAAYLSVDEDEDFGVGASYEFGNFTVGMDYDANHYVGDDWDVYVKTAFNGINVKVNYDENDLIKLNLDGTSGNVDWKFEVDSNGETDAEIKVGFGDTSVKVTHDSNADYRDGTDYDSDDSPFALYVTHKVGDLELFAKVNEVSDYEVGASASFEF